MLKNPSAFWAGGRNTFPNIRVFAKVHSRQHDLWLKLHPRMFFHDLAFLEPKRLEAFFKSPQFEPGELCKSPLPFQSLPLSIMII